MIVSISYLFLAVFVGFSSSTYTATESEQQVTVCVQVLNSETGGALRPFSVSILPKEGRFQSNITEMYHSHSLFLLLIILVFVHFSLFGPPLLLQ